MKTSLEKLAQHFRVLSEILEGCFNLFISQRLFDSCIKNRSMVITEDFLAFFNNCLPLEFSCTWILQCALISDRFAGSGRKRKNNCYSTMSDGILVEIFPHSQQNRSDICRSSFNQLRNLSKIQKYLTQESSKMVVHVFITSKLVYCNSLLYGCREMQLKHQYVQNTAVRIVTQTGKFDHIMPVLFDLHWLHVSCYIFVFKIFSPVFKSLNNLSCRQTSVINHIPELAVCIEAAVRTKSIIHENVLGKGFFSVCP